MFCCMIDRLLDSGIKPKPVGEIRLIPFGQRGERFVQLLKLFFFQIDLLRCLCEIRRGLIGVSLGNQILQADGSQMEFQG